MDNKKISELERKRRNNDLIRRMKAGEPLNHFNAEASFFPPRPIIKKDRAELRKLYSTQEQKREK